MLRTSLARVLAPFALAAALLGATAAAAGAHASLTGSDPAPGQRLEESPTAIVLRFSENLSAPLSDAELSGPGGRRVSVRTQVRGSELIARPASPLPQGSYLLRWRTVSPEDSHPLQGSVGFGVRAAAAGGDQAVEQSPLANLGWLRAVSRALLYASLLSFAGALLVGALLRRPLAGAQSWVAPDELGRSAPQVDVAAARRRAENAVGDIGAVAVGAGATVAIVESATAAGRLSAGAVLDYLLSSASGGARVAIIVLPLLALALARRRPGFAALAAVGALGAVATTGHASSANPRGAAVMADWLHLAAGAVWVGGIALLALVWGRVLWTADGSVRLALMRVVLPGFGRLALPAFATAVLAGVLNSVIELGSVRALWESAYGRVLLVKVGLVAGAGALAYAHAFRLRPRLLAANPHPAPDAERRHWRLLGAEVPLALAVVVAAGVLVSFPLPPRQSEAASAGAGSVPACDPCPLPRPRAGELAVAEQAGSDVVAAWVRPEGAGLAGTVRLLDRRGRPAPDRAFVQGASQSSCGRGCLTFRTATRTPALRVAVVQGGRGHQAILPVAFRPGASGDARRLLERAQATMRGLRSVRQDEDVTSGPGTGARTIYRLRAPDRLELRTAAGVQRITIGARQFVRGPGAPWREAPTAGGRRFRTASWFRWSVYAAGVELLEPGGGPVDELALADPAVPAWIRLTVERRTGRVLRERLVARARFITTRFSEWNAPVDISAPSGHAGGG